MNTLVEEGDGPAPSPHDGPGTGAPGEASPSPTSDRATCTLASAEPTLFEVIVPADNMTLVEVAPQSGQTLIFLPADQAAPRSPRAQAARPVVAAPTKAGGLVSALGLARPQRLRVWGPVLACVLSLGATALPLWRHAPRPAPEENVAATTVAAPAPLPARSDLDPAGVAADPTVGNGDVATARRVDGDAVQPAPPGRRRHPSAGSSARRKARGPVMRTRNGAPLVD